MCLLLVCCILINCSPIKAHALDPVTAYCWVEAGKAVLNSLVADGIQKGGDALVHSDLANQIVEDMKNAGAFIVDGMVKVMLVQTGTMYKSYLPYEFIEWVQNWLYEQEVIVSSLGSGFNLSAGSYICTDTPRPYKASIDCTVYVAGTINASSGILTPTQYFFVSSAGAFEVYRCNSSYEI